jgi:hypothetical protein
METHRGALSTNDQAINHLLLQLVVFFHTQERQELLAKESSWRILVIFAHRGTALRVHSVRRNRTNKVRNNYITNSKHYEFLFFKEQNASVWFIPLVISPRLREVRNESKLLIVHSSSYTR